MRRPPIAVAALGLFAVGLLALRAEEPANEPAQSATTSSEIVLRRDRNAAPPVATTAVAADASVAKGIVFHDANGNESYDEGEKPMSGVRVSNGEEVVVTDEDGRYELPVDDGTILFVVKPRNWRTPLNETNNPRFYYVHKPSGSPQGKRYAGVEPTGPLPESVDFPLYPQEEPEKFQAILFGDPQPRTQQEVDWIAHDVVEELIGTDAAFGVTLGDIVFDDLDLFEPQAKAIALIGVPWYNVLGNHDVNYDATSDELSDETFERHYGPNYYSFDYGPAHFVVLDDVEWVVKTPGKRGSYRGGLGEKQLAFVENDLAHVPDEKLVVLLMHIPLTGVTDRHPLYRLIEKRPACISISGHTHTHEHVFIDGKDGWKGPQPHHHIVNVTVSGSWWSGSPDERGIPHTQMRDGGPNGYSILTVEGTDYVLDYKAAGRPADYQMQIAAPEAVATADLEKTDLWVNVFNGSAKSSVEFRVGGGDWSPMTQRRVVDPLFKWISEYETKMLHRPWRALPKPANSSHLWHAKLPADLPVGVHVVEVRAKDMWGRVYEDKRVIRVTD